MTAYGSSGSVATLRTGIPCDFCGAEIPLGRRHGSERRFCSDKCRRDSWDAAHPRLDFSAAGSVPVPHLSSTDPGRLAPDEDFLRHSTEAPQELPAGNPTRRRGQGSTGASPAPATGEPYESARLWLLARLQAGPVCTLELRREPWPASLNPAQRVLELRNRQHHIVTERRDGKTWYRLEEGEECGYCGREKCGGMCQS